MTTTITKTERVLDEIKATDSQGKIYIISHYQQFSVAASFGRPICITPGPTFHKCNGLKVTKTSEYTFELTDCETKLYRMI